MKTLLYLILFFSIPSVFAQEICDNGIDDDADGLIDLNDVADCDCSIGGSPSSLIPNPSFETFACCPSFHTQLGCATGWEQATIGSSDYFNQCDYSYLDSWADDPSPYPDGNGCAGFYAIQNSGQVMNEYIGACLTSPMLAGVSYSLKLKVYTSISFGWLGYTCNSNDLDLTIFGTDNCVNFPLTGFNMDCPTLLSSNWVDITSTHVDFVASTWQTVTITFTPTTNIAAIIIGAGCNAATSPICPGAPAGEYINYYYVDNLLLSESSSFTGVTISQSGLYCGNNIVLSSTLGTPIVNPTYQWYKGGIAIMGATNATYNVPAGATGLGFYQVRVSDGTNCAVSALYEVKDEPLAFTTTVVDATCFGKNDGSITINPTNGTAPYTNYINSVLLPSNVSNNLIGGNYTVLVNDAVGCSSTALVVVTDPAPVQVQTTTPLCLPTGNANLTANASGGTGPYTFLWDNMTTAPNYAINVIQDQVYTVQAIDVNNCVSSIENIQVNYRPAIDFTADKLFACPGTEINFTLLVDGVASTTAVSAARWIFETGSSTNITNVKHTFNNTGTYTVSVDVTFTNGCSATLEKIDLIGVYDAPQAQFTAEPQPTTILNSTIHFKDRSIGANAYQWTTLGTIFGGSPHAEYKFDDQNGGKYEVCLEVTSIHGCRDLQCSEIVITDDLMLYVPNSFTPDADGKNDVFKVAYDGSNIESFELILFNRWGELVKKLEHQDETWDGTINGKPAPLGVYSWTLAVKYTNHELILRKGERDVSSIAIPPFRYLFKL
jgi:gliding motility-associated-like protein